MEEFLRSLSITEKGELKGDVYSISLNSFDKFAMLYNKLEQSEKLAKDSESFFNIDGAHVIYTADGYQINLNGDLNNDIYELTVQEIEEES